MESTSVTNANGELSIKSKERVNKFGEVFTPSNIVKDMLDLDGVREYSYTFDKTFLEPACGNGNFLVEILARKLSCLDALDTSDRDNWLMHMFQAIATIYGIDIQNDNVEESRERMHQIILDKYKAAYNDDMSSGIERCVNAILVNNIVCGNFLTETFEKDTTGTIGNSQRRTKGETLSNPMHREKDTLEIIEWTFEFDKKTVKAKAFSLEAIREKSEEADYEYKEVKYNQLFRAEKCEVSNSFDDLNI